ncbi:MAG TPA: hypothetical protein VJV79_21840 [Polyangiaceae bacterium]|nr:hypothetical protein [Polyangiaceae bacterium]
MSREESRAHDDLDNESTAGKREVHTADIGVLERHHRPRAPALESESEFCNPQFCAARKVGQRLPLVDLVRDGATDTNLERNDQRVDSLTDRPHAAAKSRDYARAFDRRNLNKVSISALNSIRLAFGGV